MGRANHGGRRQALLFGPGEMGEELSKEYNTDGTVPTVWAAVEGRGAC